MALNTTQVLVRTIYQAPGEQDAQDQDIEGLAKDVCEECIKILKEPEKNQAKHAIKVICAFVSTTRAFSRDSQIRCALLILLRSLCGKVYFGSGYPASRATIP